MIDEDTETVGEDEEGTKPEDVGDEDGYGGDDVTDVGPVLEERVELDTGPERELGGTKEGRDGSE